MIGWVFAGVFAVVAGVFAFMWYKVKADDAADKKAREAEDRVKSTTKGVLDRSGVGPVLAVASDMSILFYNRDFVEIFPDVVNAKNISSYPEMERLFKDEEYVSETLSKIYEIRQESIEDVNVSGKFVWLVDITEHYKTNKRLRELKEMADAANKAKSNFLANMSHEIRTPINTVLGMDEIILREATEVPIKGYAENIREAATTLLSIVNDLLDFSKIESGKMEILPVEYEIANAMNEVINMIEIKAVNKKLEFKTIIAEDIPYLLFGDDVRLKQIIINLLTNAVKYTEDGSVILKVDWKEAGDSSIFLIVSVTDTGIGIKEEDIEKLFVSFERIEERRNRNIEGTGLGLSITRQLLELMNSELNVRSEYGVGSTFSFTLKQGIRDRKPVGRFREKYAYSNEKVKKYRTTFVAPDAKILVVDDNAMNLSVVEGLLKNTKLQIDCASSGEAALEMAKDLKYDMIFMDHMMPYMDGIETLKHLRQMEKSPNVDTPVIVLTANAVSGAKEMYLEEGFIDYMSKPIQGKRLEEKIVQYLPKDKYVMIEYEDMEKKLYANLWKAVADEIESEYKFKNIDVPTAVEAAEGDKETVQFLFSSFRDNEEKNRKEIVGAYEQEDYPNYTVFVHALKSTSKMIGANNLSEQAKKLEKAGKEGDIDYIKKNHEKLMKTYEQVVKEVKDYLGQKNDNEDSKKNKA
ncbi:MAG: response regulator [Lachnospiraceae bacterium]|nr:response regulator [Lachnospiraceae bacterium]